MAPRYPDLVYRLVGRFGTSRFVTRLHPLVYRATGGAGPIGRNLGVRNVVVTTTGRVTGREREVPLYALEDGDRWVLVGSNAGSDREPAWVGNLRANPVARLRVGRALHPVRAREAEGDEHERLWELAVATYPGYATYRCRTARRIPLVVLEREDPA